MANINKIRLSGQTYSIQDENATTVVSLTQAQYDALAVKDPNTLYNITDASGGDLSQYMTSAQTMSAITEATSGKADSNSVYLKTETSGATQISTALATKADTATTYTKSETSGATQISTALADKLDVTAYTPCDLSNYYTKSETSGSTQISTALSNKQDTLSAGTNITIEGNVISATGGGGGGKAIEAGRGISITTGETADTVSFNLPIIAGSGENSIVENSTNAGWQASGNYSHSEGNSTRANGNYSHAEGYMTTANTWYSHSEGDRTYSKGIASHTEGANTVAENNSEHASGQYNVSNKANTTFGDSGNTLFSVGNGTADNARHNAFEIRQNGDIYITSGGTDIKLQDNLGGGGSVTVDPSLDITSPNAVANSAITTALNDTVKLSNLSTYYINGFTNYVNRTIPIFHRFDINNQSDGNAWWFGKINDKYVITTGQTSVTPSDLMNLQVVETSAITTSITSSSTDAQVPSAKAVYDALQEGGGSVTVDSAISSSSTNPVQNAVIYQQFGGLKLQQITQSAYDALSTKDASTLYVIVN